MIVACDSSRSSSSSKTSSQPSQPAGGDNVVAMQQQPARGSGKANFPLVAIRVCPESGGREGFNAGPDTAFGVSLCEWDVPVRQTGRKREWEVRFSPPSPPPFSPHAPHPANAMGGRLGESPSPPCPSLRSRDAITVASVMKYLDMGCSWRKWPLVWLGGCLVVRMVPPFLR